MDSHYKREGDGQYTGGMHIQNVSIPLFNYLFSEKIESVPMFLRMYARLFYSVLIYSNFKYFFPPYLAVFGMESIH